MRSCFWLLVLLSACATVPPAEEADRIAGHYRFGFEVEAFRPCGSSEDWWVTTADELRSRAERLSGTSRPVYAVVRARVSPRGEYGHLGQYPRQVSVVEVLEMRPARSSDCPAATDATASRGLSTPSAR